MFNVPKTPDEANPQGLWRPCTNLKNINAFICTNYFRLRTLMELTPYLRTGLWATKVDLKSAYFYCPISSRDRLWLSVQHQQEFFQWQSLPFGLNIAPREWRRMMQAIINRLCPRKMTVWCYLDDFIMLGRSWYEAYSHTQEWVQLLRKLGMEVNYPKSVLSPTQTLVWIGFKLNFIRGILQVPREKLKPVLEDLDRLCRADAPSVRRVAAVLGRNRAWLQVLPHLRNCTDALAIHGARNVRYGWEAHQPMHPRVLTQPEQACTQLATWKGRSFQTPVRREMQCYSDASDWAWVATSPGSGEAFGFFTNSDLDLHINAKEFQAAIFALRSYMMGDPVIKFYTDWTTLFHYIRT